MTRNLIHELWSRRSLVILLAMDDIKTRYRNSILGFLWTFLEPLLMLSVLYFVFSNIFKSNIQDYPLYLLLGLIIWYMFSRSSTMGLSSLINKGSIIQQIYFRREIVVISACLTAFIMMVFEFAAFGVFATIFHLKPSPTIALLPLVLIDVFFMSLGISFFLSVLNVRFRDISFIWQVVLQAGFFISPIIYKLDMFPENISAILKFNPLVPIFDAAHSLVLYNTLPSLISVAYMIISTAIIFIVGYLVFRINSKKIAEEL